MTCWINKKKPWNTCDVLADNKDAQRFYEKHGLYAHSIEQYTEIQ